MWEAQNTDAGDQQDSSDELFRLMQACGHILYHSGSGKTGQGRILHILDYQQSVSQKDLQTMLDIKSGSISELLSKLEREGLIRREKDEKDRRRVIVTMTEAGRAHAQQFHAQNQEKDRFAVLNREQREQLKELLELLLEDWRSE